jgi:hypothetical protein
VAGARIWRRGRDDHFPSPAWLAAGTGHELGPARRVQARRGPQVGVDLARVEVALRLFNDRIGRRRRAVTGFTKAAAASARPSTVASKIPGSDSPDWRGEYRLLRASYRGGAEFLQPQYPKHWPDVHSVQWWKLHWAKTELVDLRCAALLPESDDLLLDYVPSRPSEQDEDSIMAGGAARSCGLIALFRLVARKHCR